MRLIVFNFFNMKRVLRKVLTVWALGGLMLFSNTFSMAQSGDNEAIAITLKDALEIAQSKSLTVMVADKEIQKSGYAKKGSYAALFPKIDFSGAYQRTIKRQTMAMSMGGTTQKISVGTDNVYNIGLSAQMPLVNVALWKSLEISALGVDMAVEQARQSRQNLINQVEQAFYTCLLAKDLTEVYKENYNHSKELYLQTKAMYESGRAAKYDMIRAEVNMQNAEPNMYNSQNSLILALWQLKALMGIELNTEIECVGSLDDYTSNIQDLVIASDSIDLSNNSSLKQLDIQGDILEKTYKAQRAQYYPSLGLSASYQYTAMANDFKFGHYSWNPYSVASLGLSIPVFAGGERRNTLRQTKVQRQQLELQRENARRGLVVAAKQSISSMETALKQYSAAKATLEGAQTGFDIAKKRYEVGSGTVLEMNDAQLALLQAKLNLNQSIHSFLVAKSALELTLGKKANEERVNSNFNE